MRCAPAMRLLPVLFLLAAPAFAPLGAQESDERDAVEPAVSREALSTETPAAPVRGEARVMDELDLERTEITGNRELPKVLYIVPWKTSDLGDLVGRPVNSLLDEVLAPVDREVFVRQVGYYQNLYAGPEAGDESGSDAGSSQ
ncbi:hypothetical protein [Lentisalinibacter salinarum]|uniref:hypothetical protein n=1 Tax=Lentisalinibacter salinarum TaxID=2992239 RepID=UPI0038706D68